MKRQPVEWEKIFTDHTSDKGLLYEIYKELKQLNENKRSNYKWVEKLNRHFFRRRHTNCQQVHRKMLTLTIYLGHYLWSNVDTTWGLIFGFLSTVMSQKENYFDVITSLGNPQKAPGTRIIIYSVDLTF